MAMTLLASAYSTEMLPLPSWSWRRGARTDLHVAGDHGDGNGSLSQYGEHGNFALWVGVEYG